MTTIARPYAVAAFEFASNKKNVAQWEVMLNTASMLTQDPHLQQLLMNPRITKKQKADFYIETLSVTAEMKNFICLLAEYHRLSALPEIASLFKSYRAEQEKTMTVDVISASRLTTDFQTKLADVLTKRFHRQVSLNCSIDENLLGGAVIKVDDQVIDGSVRGKLNRMNEFILGTSGR